MSIRHAAVAATFAGGVQRPPSTSDDEQNNKVAKYICTCVRDILIACMIALIIIAFISVISSLIIRPRSPRFSVVSAAAVAAVNVTGAEFKTVCNLSLLAHNPNPNLVIWYRRFDVKLLYGSDYYLSETRLEPMFQRKHNQTVLSAQFVSDDFNVENDVVGGLASELRRGVVTFRVRISAIVRFKRGRWLTKNYGVKADCEGVDIGFNATGFGSLVEPSRQCEGLYKTGS